MIRRMFRQLTNFSYQRTPVQAVGFYLFYLILTVLAAAIAGGIAGLVSPETSPETSFESGQRFGTLIAVVISLALSYLVLGQKQRLGNPGYLLLGIAGGLGALLLGGLLGIVAPAILSTRSSGSASSAGATPAT